MRAGIIAEGWGDIAVIENVLFAVLGLEGDDILPLRPELALDATDLDVRYRDQNAGEFSNWKIVIDECESKERIRRFLEEEREFVIEGQDETEDRIVVVHIDAAESELKGYDVKKPRDRKAHDYGHCVYKLIQSRLEALLGKDLAPRVRFAIAVEETEAWLLPLYSEAEKRDTAVWTDPKRKFKEAVRRADKQSKHTNEYGIFRELSAPLRKKKALTACAKKNASLRALVEALEA